MDLTERTTDRVDTATKARAAVSALRTETPVRRKAAVIAVVVAATVAAVEEVRTTEETTAVIADP